MPNFDLVVEGESQLDVAEKCHRILMVQAMSDCYKIGGHYLNQYCQ